MSATTLLYSTSLCFEDPPNEAPLGLCPTQGNSGFLGPVLAPTEVPGAEVSDVHCPESTHQETG